MSKGQGLPFEASEGEPPAGAGLRASARLLFPSVILALLLVLSPAAQAASGQITEFPAPESLSGLVMGPDGNLWSAEGQAIARFSSEVQLTSFPTSRPTYTAEDFQSTQRGESLNYTSGLLTAGRDGAVWFVNGRQGEPKDLGRITPDGQVTEFHIGTPGVTFYGMTSGAEGDLWLTEAEPAQIFRVAPSHEITVFPLPSTPHGWPTAITLGPEGNLWYTGANAIGRVTPNGGFTEFPLPTPYIVPRSITLGPDGNLWFAGDNKGTIGRVTPAGQITEFSLDHKLKYNEASEVTAGPDGNVWFTKSDGHDRHVPDVNPPPYQTPVGLTEGEIGRITPSGQITEFQIPSGASARAITAGPDGDLWFSESAPRIGRIEPGLIGIELVDKEATARNGHASLMLACGGGASGSKCRGTIRLRLPITRKGMVRPRGLHSVGLGQMRYSLRRERGGRFDLPLNIQARKILEHRSHVRILVTTTVTGGATVGREIVLNRFDRKTD